MTQLLGSFQILKEKKEEELYSHTVYHILIEVLMRRLELYAQKQKNTKI
jgi:hypothetical protein